MYSGHLYSFRVIIQTISDCEILQLTDQNQNSTLKGCGGI